MREPKNQIGCLRRQIAPHRHARGQKTGERALSQVADLAPRHALQGHALQDSRFDRQNRHQHPTLPPGDCLLEQQSPSAVQQALSCPSATGPNLAPAGRQDAGRRYHSLRNAACLRPIGKPGVGPFGHAPPFRQVLACQYRVIAKATDTRSDSAMPQSAIPVARSPLVRRVGSTDLRRRRRSAHDGYGQGYGPVSCAGNGWT
jgi:hypothetical protein